MRELIGFALVAYGLVAGLALGFVWGRAFSRYEPRLAAKIEAAIRRVIE